MATIVVAGVLGAKPGNGGEAWVRLSWVLGLRRLGHDAWLLEELAAAPTAEQRAFFAAVVAAHGLADRAVLIAPGAVEGALGSMAEVEAVADDAALLVNISGNLRDPDLRGRFRRRAYLDVDPGFTQLWHVQRRLGDELAEHHRCFTVGLSIGAAGCEVPTGGVRWEPLPPAVLLDAWPATPPAGRDRFTTVATWRNALGTVAADGRTFTLKHHQLRRIRDLPRRAPGRFELAVAAHPADAPDLDDLRASGWSVVDAAAVAADPAAFRAYVQGSSAELSAAQGVYVEARTGWFSDRTAHYLASGRPALVQDTGLPQHLHGHAGLLTFTTPDDAAVQARRLLEHYDEHAAGARAFAESHLDSDRVIGSLLERCEVTA